MTTKHPDDFEREDRREGRDGYTVRLPVQTTVRGNNPADAERIARRLIQQAIDDSEVSAELVSGAEVHRHDEY